MQPHQQVPNLTQQTTAEDRISRRVHERILLMPGVIDRRDGAHQVGRLNHFGVSDRGLAESIQRRWRMAGAMPGSQSVSLPYVHAQRRSEDVEADALVANEIPSTARASRGRILEQQVVADKVASAGQAPIASLAPGAGDEVNRSTVNPLAGDIDASATGDRIAARASGSEHGLPVVRAQRRTVPVGSTIDAFIMGHVAQRQAPAEAMVPFTAPGGADALAETQHGSENPSSGGLSNVLQLRVASTGVRDPAEIAQSGGNPTASSQAHQSPSSENPPPFSGNMRAASVAGITAAVQPNEARAATVWGAPIIQRRVIGQRGAPAQRDVAGAAVGASPIDLGPSLQRAVPNGGSRAGAIGSRELPAVQLMSGAVLSATIQPHERARGMVALQPIRQANRGLPAAVETSQPQVERTASAAAGFTAPDALQPHAGATKSGESVQAPARAEPGIRTSVSSPSVQRSSALEDHGPASTMANAPAALPVQPLGSGSAAGSMTELVLRAKAGESAASPAVTSGGPSSIPGWTSVSGGMEGVVAGSALHPAQSEAVRVSAKVGEKPATDSKGGDRSGDAKETKANLTHTGIGGDMPAVFRKPTASVPVEAPTPGQAVPLAVTPSSSSRVIRAVAGTLLSPSADSVCGLIADSAPSGHGSAPADAQLMRHSVPGGDSSHGEPQPGTPTGEAESLASQPLVHVSLRGVSRSSGVATAGRLFPVGGLPQHGAAITTALRKGSAQEMVMLRVVRSDDRDTGAVGSGDAHAVLAPGLARHALPGEQVGEPAIRDRLVTQFVDAASVAPKLAEQIVTVVQASQATAPYKKELGSVLPLHQGHATLGGPVGPNLSGLVSIPGNFGRTHYTNMAVASNSPATHGMADSITPGVQRLPAAHTSAVESAGGSASLAGASLASPASQGSAPAQGVLAETIDLERVASAVYGIIRDRLMLERESRGL